MFPTGKSAVCVCRIETGKEACYAENEQEALVELSFFLNEQICVAYNELCRKCCHGCKQCFRAIVIECPKYLSKRFHKGPPWTLKSG